MPSLSDEFKELLEGSGWSQAEAARRLELQPPSISRYCKGVEQPSRQTLRLFKIILSNEQPEILGPARLELRDDSTMAEWERKLLDDLRPLHVGDRNRVINAVSALIHGLPKRQPISYKLTSSSRKLSAAQLLAEKAGEKYDRENQKP